MESLQLSQVLADLSNLGAAEPEAAQAIVNANTPAAIVPRSEPDTPPTSTVAQQASQQQKSARPSVLKRAWSTEAGPVDKFGRRIMVTSPTSRNGSTGNSTPGTPALNQPERNLDNDLERASTLMALYDIRAKLKQQDNSSLVKAREKINALAAKQQAQQAAEKNAKQADEMRRNRYSFPKPGL